MYRLWIPVKGRYIYAHSGFSVGGRHKIEAAAMEIDGTAEIAGVASASGVLDPFNL